MRSTGNLSSNNNNNNIITYVYTIINLFNTGDPCSESCGIFVDLCCLKKNLSANGTRNQLIIYLCSWIDPLYIEVFHTGDQYNMIERGASILGVTWMAFQHGLSVDSVSKVVAHLEPLSRVKYSRPH